MPERPTVGDHLTPAVAGAGRGGDGDLAARILASMPSFTIVVGDDLVIRHVSGNAPAHVGLTPDQLEGRSAADVIVAEDLEALVESAAYSLGHTGDVLGPVMFRFRNGHGGVCVAEAMSLNRVDDPDLRGLVVSIRDRCGLDLLDKALEALGAGSGVSVIAGLLLRAIELPPVVGSGWLVELPGRLADLSVPIDLPNGRVQIGVSIGVAQGAPDALTRVLEHADTAMYDAKAAGRGRWRQA